MSLLEAGFPPRFILRQSQGALPKTHFAHATNPRYNPRKPTINSIAV